MFFKQDTDKAEEQREGEKEEEESGGEEEEEEEEDDVSSDPDIEEEIQASHSQEGESQVKIRNETVEDEVLIRVDQHEIWIQRDE